MKEAFGQLESESAKAFAAFSVYLSLGEERSLDCVARKIGKSKTLMERWSTRHGWVSRADAHDRNLVTVQAEAQTALLRHKAVEWGKRQQDLREEEWTIHEECIRAGREALTRFYDRGRGATLGDVARILELASKLGRLASGLATDKTEVTGQDGGAIRVELEAALKKVYGQVEPAPDLVALPVLEAGTSR
jgi:hypothetical protein